MFNRDPGFRGGREEGSRCLAEDGLSRAMEKSQEWSPPAPGQLTAEGVCWFKAVMEMDVLGRWGRPQTGLT